MLEFYAGNKNDEVDLYLSTQKDVNYIALREKASDKEYAEYNSVDVKFVVWRACLHA